MKEITITTQAELDALPDAFSEQTAIYIKGGTRYEPIIVRKARGSSHVVARGSSHVVARESSHVEAWELSHVVARGSSHVEARESSHVEARESSHVVAWESSHVVAWESSHVEAWGSVSVHVHSASGVELFGFAVAILLTKIKVSKKSKTCTVVEPEKPVGNKGWLESQGIKSELGFVTLFKRVSSDFKTQENTANETVWTIGKTLTHPNWNPTTQECGPGKFHACSRPYFCDEFRDTKDDKYVAIKIAVKDLHAWPGAVYPHKVAFRKGIVLYVCDKAGRKL